MVTDEEFVSQLAKDMAAITQTPSQVGAFLRRGPEKAKELIEAEAKKKGYIDGPRFERYLQTLEGMLFYMNKLTLERERLGVIPKWLGIAPARVLLTEEEKEGVISQFKQLMKREPTVAEKSELFAEERKRKEVMV